MIYLPVCLSGVTLGLAQCHSKLGNAAFLGGKINVRKKKKRKARAASLSQLAVKTWSAVEGHLPVAHD